MGRTPVKSDSVTDGSKPLQGRQETFCQIHVIGKTSASESYRQAGYSQLNADVSSSKLLVKFGIKARIAHLRAQWAEKLEITRETLASEYNRAYEIAEREDHAPGMVAATTGKARLFGFDKQVIETTVDQPMSRTEQQEADDWAEFTLWKAGRGSVGPEPEPSPLSVYKGT